MPKSIEFETELMGGSTLDLPPEVASALPASGKATIVVLVDFDPEDSEWQRAAYERFFADDSQAPDHSRWHEFISRTYGSCAGLGLEEPG